MFTFINKKLNTSSLIEKTLRSKQQRARRKCIVTAARSVRFRSTCLRSFRSSFLIWVKNKFLSANRNYCTLNVQSVKDLIFKIADVCSRNFFRPKNAEKMFKRSTSSTLFLFLCMHKHFLKSNVHKRDNFWMDWFGVFKNPDTPIPNQDTTRVSSVLIDISLDSYWLWNICLLKALLEITSQLMNVSRKIALV